MVDSMRSIALIAGVLGRAGEMGQARRKRAAADGIVTWKNETEVEWFMHKHLKALQRKAAEDARVSYNAAEERVDGQERDLEVEATVDTPGTAELR